MSHRTLSIINNNDHKHFLRLRTVTKMTCGGNAIAGFVCGSSDKTSMIPQSAGWKAVSLERFHILVIVVRQETSIWGNKNGDL